MSKQTKEQEILKLYEFGLSVEEIANHLGVFTWFVERIIEKAKNKNQEE